MVRSVMKLIHNLCTVPEIGLCNENEDAMYVRPRKVYVAGVGTGSGPPPGAPQNSARLDNCEINKYTVGGGEGG